MKRMAILSSLFAGILAGGAATAAPIVELSKTCPALRYLGRDATFEVTVTNRGDSAASDVVVSDLIPSGLQFLSADNNGNREGNRVVWRLGTLGAGQSRVLKSTFRCNQIGKFRNGATVTYCVVQEDECEIEVKGIPAILLECVDDPDPIEVDGNVTYTITVTNQGTAVGTNIAIKCILPAEMSYVSGNGPTQAQAQGQTISFAPLPSLAAKANATYKVTAKGKGEGDLRFKVELTSDQIAKPVMETESTHVY